jgi:hypothetical protein
MFYDGCNCQISSSVQFDNGKTRKPRPSASWWLVAKVFTVQMRCDFVVPAMTAETAEHKAVPLARFPFFPVHAGTRIGCDTALPKGPGLLHHVARQRFGGLIIFAWPPDSTWTAAACPPRHPGAHFVHRLEFPSGVDAAAVVKVRRRGSCCRCSMTASLSDRTESYRSSALRPLPARYGCSALWRPKCVKPLLRSSRMLINGPGKSDNA